MKIKCFIGKGNKIQKRKRRKIFQMNNGFLIDLIVKLKKPIMMTIQMKKLIQLKKVDIILMMLVGL